MNDDAEVVTSDDLHQFMHELKSMAANVLRQQWSDQSLTPSDLIQSAFRRQGFKDQALNELTWKNRQHFFGAMYQAMRRTLQDHARKRQAQKRQLDESMLKEHQLSGHSPEDIAEINEELKKRQPLKIFNIEELELRDLESTLEKSPEQITALLEALEQLEVNDPDGAEVIQHRVYSDLTLKQTAEMMGVSVKTVQRKWDRAWPWLHKETLRRLNADDLVE